jgi:two-component system cell cycle sensor histidine kinase/response regulator CckA
LIAGGGAVGVEDQTTGQRVILLAEDDELVRNLIQTVLTREGYSILSAQDGEEALLLSRQYSGQIELLLTDVKMPKMDGLQLRDHLLRERPDIKILLISGRLSGQLSDKTIHFLRKPFLAKTLRAAVKSLL